MSKLTREEVLRVAKLARLDLSDAEVVSYQNRLGRVLDYIKDLSALDTPKEIVKHVPKDAVAFREDRSMPFASPKLLLENAPASEGDSFLLPAILEHS